MCEMHVLKKYTIGVQPTWTWVGTTRGRRRTVPTHPSQRLTTQNRWKSKCPLLTVSSLHLRSVKPSAVASSSEKCARRSLVEPSDRQACIKLFIQGGFFHWYPPKNFKCQPVSKFWHLELFWWDLLCNLTLRTLRGVPVKKTTLYENGDFPEKGQNSFGRMRVPFDILFEKGKELLEIDLTIEAWMDTIVDFSNSGFGKLGRLLRVGGNIIWIWPNGGVKLLTSSILLKQKSVFWYVACFSGGSRNTAASTRAPEELTLLNPKTIIEEVEVSDNDGQAHDQQRDGGLDNHAGLKSENYPCVEISNESKIWPGWFSFWMMQRWHTNRLCRSNPHFWEIKNILEVLPHLHVLVSITIPHSKFKRGRRVQAKNSLNWEI